MRGRSINVADEWMLENSPDAKGCDVFVLIVGRVNMIHMNGKSFK